jgi:hypothetical protein
VGGDPTPRAAPLYSAAIHPVYRCRPTRLASDFAQLHLQMQCRNLVCAQLHRHAQYRYLDITTSSVGLGHEHADDLEGAAPPRPVG